MAIGSFWHRPKHSQKVSRRSDSVNAGLQHSISTLWYCYFHMQGSMSMLLGKINVYR